MPIFTDCKKAVELIKPGSSIAFGTFLAVGAAQSLIDALVEVGTGDLHMIAIATDYEDKGVGKLIANKQVKSVQASHIGTNKATQAQMRDNEIKIELVPQGTLLERLRAAGSGLGGILTPTGIGTIVEEGKQILELNGENYLLELPIKPDFAFIKAKKADRFGNLIYSKTARNANPVMAMAADITIVEADEILEDETIPPEDVITPGIFVDYVVKSEVQ